MIARPRHHLGRYGDVTGTGGVSKPSASPAGRSAVVSLPAIAAGGRPGCAGACLRPGDETAAHGRAMRPSTTTTCLCAGEHQRRQSSSPYSAGPAPPRYRRCRGGAGNSWNRGALLAADEQGGHGDAGRLGFLSSDGAAVARCASAFNGPAAMEPPGVEKRNGHALASASTCHVLNNITSIIQG